jgi:hypothetical protein
MDFRPEAGMRLADARSLAVLTAVSAAWGLPSQGATISTLAAASDAGGDVFTTDDIGDTAAENRRSAATSASAGAASASAAGDFETGALHSALALGGVGSASTAIQMNATFTATGAGRVDLLFDTDWSWSRAAPGSHADFLVDLASDGDFSTFSFDTSTAAPSGRDRTRLTYSIVVADGQASGLGLGFLSDIDSGAGWLAVDGVLSWRSPDGVSLAFDDPRILIAPVPLPAGGALVLGGLAALALLWRRPGPGTA